MKQDYVEFYSPGTFVAEPTRKEIDSWNIDKAVSMARSIVERHSSRPYGFRFITRERSEHELDAKVTKKSCMYYLGGIVKTLSDVEAENNPRNRTLISNMKCNRWNRIITNNNSWSWTQPLNEDDVILDVTLSTLPKEPRPRNRSPKPSTST